MFCEAKSCVFVINNFLNYCFRLEYEVSIHNIALSKEKVSSYISGKNIFTDQAPFINEKSKTVLNKYVSVFWCQGLDLCYHGVVLN